MKEKKCTIFKRVFSLAMAVFMTLMLAMPAMVRSEVASAAGAGTSGNYKITIKNKENLPAMEEGQFAAYQIFTGVLNPEEEDDPAADEELQLADIKWGEGVNSTALIAALIKESNKDGSALYGEFDDTLATDPKAAEHIANILADNKDNARFLQAFADIVNTDECIVKEKAITSTLEGSNSVIDCKVPGYYLVVQKKTPGVGDDGDRDTVYSDYILQVVGEQTIEIKADIPEVDKKITGSTNDSSQDNADSVGIGDVVNFEITGTLPTTDAWKAYEKYFYEFADTLSKGLKYNEGSLEITVRNSTSATKIEILGTSETDDGKKAKLVVEETGAATNITVTIADLKKIIEDIDTKDIEIVVTYSATVTSDAVIGNPGENNKVSLKYSNNPNTDEHGETTTKVVYEYSFSLNLTKIGDDTSTALPGAKFVLKNSEGKIAVFGDSGDGTGVKKLSEWKALEEAVRDGGITADGDNITGVTDDKYMITSQETTGKFGVQGLGEGTYTLVEVVTPDGYNTLDPIEFTITPEYDAEGKLTGLTATVKGDRSADVTAESTDYSAGLVSKTLVNHKAPTLPNTGGIGTIIFYVAGGLLLAGAAVYLVISRTRKETK